ncbi:M64 family metallopeptidase [Rubripirellula reticaptiva]|uniref:IgA Peptidase M64 n=1 Tax=Rubripirellula reticaptiva TaxID=2528013 RepID=A0A5C6EMS2_9BACT|nr:M64 family metallopeptidase [Rubripirellula reticaptiva]TWU49700.1 IgA Peptidase M64 [Rubripirellula reticaptiva]
MRLSRFMFICAAASAIGAQAIGNAAELTTILNNGSSTNRVDVMFIGDGYTSTELGTTYTSHIDQAISYFFDTKDPFPRYKNFFNFHRVDVVSNESGADDPVNGITRDTALNATYNTNGIDRLLYFNTGIANAEVNSAIAGTGVDVDMRIGVVNSTKYGGGGGQWAVYAGGNASALEVAVHEVGHSFARLADEYFSPGTYTGSEPGEANVTADPALGKWDRWLGYTDPDNPSIGEIGYYEGGKYVENGIYRPSNNSLMRSLNRPLDAVGREAFIEKIYAEVDPLDAWTDTAATLSMFDDVWVDVIDESVINVQWLIDGIDSGMQGSMLDIAALGLADGNYTLTAKAYDNLLDSSFTGNTLDWWRLDDAPLTQSVSWNLSVVAVPEPGSFAFLVIGLTVPIAIRRRRR